MSLEQLAQERLKRRQEIAYLEEQRRNASSFRVEIMRELSKEIESNTIAIKAAQNGLVICPCCLKYLPAEFLIERTEFLKKILFYTKQKIIEL